MAMSARHIIYFTLLVAVLSGTAILGFKEEAYRENVYGEPTPNPAQVETTVGFVKLTMNLNKTIYRVGELINIALKLTNISNRTIWLNRSSPPVLDFIVYATVYNKSLPLSYPPTFKPIYAYSWEGFIGILVSHCIEPNESLNMTLTWNQLGKYGNGSQAIYEQVAPGFYFITGRTAPDLRIYNGIEEKSAEVETPKVLIAITPKESVIAEATKFPLRLKIILDKTKFGLGETVKMVFFAENIGNRTIDMSMYEDYFSFVVCDEAGSEIYDWNKNHGHIALYIPMALPSGLSRMGILEWNQDYNLKLITLDPHPQFEYRKVSPGRYQIIGQFISSHLRFTIETPPITITIGCKTESIEAIPRQ